MLNREVGFALNSGHCQPRLSGPFRAKNGSNVQSRTLAASQNRDGTKGLRGSRSAIKGLYRAIANRRGYTRLSDCIRLRSVDA